MNNCLFFCSNRLIKEHAGKSRVNVIDSNRPGDVILTFDIHGANVLSIATVSGVKDNDYGPPPHDLVPTEEKEAPADHPEANFSGIRYVSCSVAGSEPIDQPKDTENDGKNCKCAFFLFICCVFYPFVSFVPVFQPSLSKRKVSLVEGIC